jgi:hypothetical protein
MAEKSDAFVLLVGGIGSIDEVTELLELKKQKQHNKPIVVLNTDGFYDGLKNQFKRMKQEGFIRQVLDDMIYFVDTPVQAIGYIDKMIANIPV